MHGSYGARCSAFICRLELQCRFDQDLVTALPLCVSAMFADTFLPRHLVCHFMSPAFITLARCRSNSEHPRRHDRHQLDAIQTPLDNYNDTTCSNQRHDESHCAARLA